MPHRLLFSLIALFVAVVTACSPATGSNPPAQPVPSGTSASAPINVQDDAGRSVTLPRAAARIVSLAPSNTELLFALGLGDRVVGVDDYSDFPEPAKKIEKVGGYSKINLEKVVSLTPDLILATNLHEKTIVPDLQGRGIAVVVVQPKTVEAVLDSVMMVGKLTGQDAKAADLAKSLRGRLESLAAKVKGATVEPRVYFELASTLFTVGPGSFVDDMIKRAGGKNIAADAKTEWPQLNVESIILKDPEVIILSDYGQSDAPANVKARPGWQVISAVKADRVLKMNADLLNRPGPRVFDGVEELVRTLHPELFR